MSVVTEEEDNDVDIWIGRGGAGGGAGDDGSGKYSVFAGVIPAGGTTTATDAGVFTAASASDDIAPSGISHAYNAGRSGVFKA